MSNADKPVLPSQPGSPRYTSPEFLASCLDAGMSRRTGRALAADIPTMVVFEAVAHREITPEQGAEILMLQREAEPWFVRFMKWLFPTRMPA